MLIFCCSKALVNTVENKDTAPSVDNSVPSLALELDFGCAVSVRDFVFKHEGNRIQHSFNSERADKLAKLESLIKIKDLTAASKLLTEERDILRKRNKILNIADKHGWDTVQEYLDSHKLLLLSPTAVSVELAKATKKNPSIELCSTA
jgi:hypothetical protein